MSSARQVRDSGLLDALEALPTRPLKGHLWRVVRDGRDPCQCGAAGGRWDDRTFDVLYTAQRGDGAVAEMYFHLSRGQPVVPSQVKYRLHQLEVDISDCLEFYDLAALEGVGLRIAAFGQLSYFERELEYPRSQEIAEAAHFLGCGGIIVPSARWDCKNVVVFCDRGGPAAIQPVRDFGLIDWSAWSGQPYGL